MGLNEDRTKAGYTPASNPITMAKAAIVKMFAGRKKYATVRDLPDNWLNNGSSNAIKPKAMKTLIRLITIDSNKNCPIIDLRSEPKVFRMPTSLALSTERAV